MSLRLRLTLWFLLGAAVLSIAAVGIIYVVQGHQVLQRLDDELRHRLEEYSSFVASSTDAAGLRTATEAYLSGEQSQVLRLGGIILLLVTDEDAIVSNSSDVRLEEIHMPERGSDGHGKPVSVATPVGRYRVVETPVLAGEREVGRVRMAAPMGTLLVSRDRVVALVALLLAIGTVGMGAGAWLVLGRALSPVKKITRAAASISREDLNRRINYVGRHDEIGELADTMDAMLERLEDAFKAQERFMSDVSHELRTPLTIAKGHIQVLDKMKVRDPALVRSEHALVLEEMDRMNRLVGDLLTLARAGRTDLLRREDVDLNALLRGLVGQGPHLAADRQWRLESVPGGTVRADQDRLTQAFLNLMQNAVAHTRAGDHIVLGGEWIGAHVDLWVRDSGEGMPPEVANRVFERFYRGPGGEQQGARFGLGLAIVSAVAEAHGGSARVETGEGKGARFVLRLPSSRKTE